MISRRSFACGLTTGLVPVAPSAWAEASAPTLAQRFPAPAGFERQAVPPASFAAWLRRLKLLPAGHPVLLHTGRPKHRQDVHAAVIDIDVGSRDLQQCADAVMRLRAEWLFATGKAHEVSFNDTGTGRPMAFSRWAAGDRPKPNGRGLIWSRSALPDASYASFRRYLDTVFTWAGTKSLERELMPISAQQIAAGDVIIRGGFPGHAVMVADLVVASTGERRVLLVQSFMPAQSIHVLRHPVETLPWYTISDSEPVVTPEWQFPPGSLKRWQV